MSVSIEASCPRCRLERRGDARLCGLCGHLFARAAEPAIELRPPRAEVELARGPSSIVAAPSRDRGVPRARSSAREAWLFLAIGLTTAPVFALTPILRFAGWFLSSLVHEMGHAAFAWACGMPAIPAISLAGHAAAVHGEQSFVLFALVAGGLAFATSKFFEGRSRVVAITIVLAAHAGLALTGAKELLHLLSGHGAELGFATLCLWKALDGGFTDSRAERALYGTVGWYLLGSNALLCAGLAFSARSRAEYAANGSFGLTNDYIRAAEDVLGWRIESVATGMLAACALVLPLSIAVWRASSGAREEDTRV